MRKKCGGISLRGAPYLEISTTRAHSLSATGVIDKRLPLRKDCKVLLMCRSGDRPARAVDALAGAGFTNVYSVIDGFEGDMSPDGRRSVNGWKNAGLPWTYKLDKAKVFQAPR